VQDPYGAKRLGPVVADHFGWPHGDLGVTTGAGVNSLLHGLSGLARGSRVCVCGEVYPDFPHWVGRVGATCIQVRDAENLPDFAGPGPHVVFLERPSLTGNHFQDLDAVRSLCREADRRNAVVIIDESNANYYSPEYSAIGLIPQVRNLLVLRGFSKAYGLGGLRLAYCVGSTDLDNFVRSVVPPLQAAPLSLRIGMMLLGLGDVGGPLRDRISAHKARVEVMLAAAGLGGVIPSSSGLPYFFLDTRADDGASVARLVLAGIIGKYLSAWPTLLKRSVPTTG